MIRPTREIIVSYDIEFDESFLRDESRWHFNSSAEQNNTLLIELLPIDMPWSDGTRPSPLYIIKTNHLCRFWLL